MTELSDLRINSRRSIERRFGLMSMTEKINVPSLRREMYSQLKKDLKPVCISIAVNAKRKKQSLSILRETSEFTA